MHDQRHKRSAFYPVCARDHIEPLQMLSGWVDLMYFCDIRRGPKGSDGLREIRGCVAEQGLPEPSFILGDALTALECLRPVDIYFQRRDSQGEGGSGLFLLGPQRLSMVVRAIKPGGLIVTDAHYVGRWYEDLVGRHSAVHEVNGRAIRLNELQPWLGANLTAFRVN